MARDTKWAVREAEEKGFISKITVDEDVQKKLLKNSRSGSFKMLFGSLIIAAIAVAIVVALIVFANVVIFSVKMLFLYLMILALPIFAVYNIFATAKALKNGDYDFHSGEIITKTDKGYKVKGLEDLDLGFLMIAKPKTELKGGDQVKIFRMNDEVHLFDL